MANITVTLNGDGPIDNAAIFFDDPQEKLPHFLKQLSDTDWMVQNINVPMHDDDELSYALFVVAFSGTAFKCVLTDVQSGKTINISDVTGKIIKNRAITKGSERFS